MSTFSEVRNLYFWLAPILVQIYNVGKVGFWMIFNLIELAVKWPKKTKLIIQLHFSFQKINLCS